MANYVLKTGEEGRERLSLVNVAFGGATSRFFDEILGVRAGMTVADVGCGAGTVSVMLAKRVGPSGIVHAIDASPGQVEVARELAEREGLTNIRFHCAGANSIGCLIDESCDVVFCRFVLVHLEDPLGALREMNRVVKVGGFVAAEEPDITSFSRCSEPEHPSFTRYIELLYDACERQKQNPRIGRRLLRTFREAGLTASNAKFECSTLMGVAKRMVALTIVELADGIVDAGLETKDSLGKIISNLYSLADDDTYIFGFITCQAWCQKVERAN